MSLVCQNCRRLVRSANIHKNEGNYFCAKCQKTYKIPDSFYKRDDLSVPELPKETKLNVQKTEDELRIKFPRHIFTLVFIFSTAILFFFTFFFLFFFVDNEFLKTHHVLLIAFSIFLLFFANALSKKTIIVDDEFIILVKEIFFLKLKKTIKLKDLKRIGEVEAELNRGRGKEVVSKFIEIEFRNEDNWEFGHKLSKQERDYVIAELKLYHFYSLA